MSNETDHLQDLKVFDGENPYDIFKGKNPIDTILGEGSIFNLRKLELYGGIKKFGKPIRLVLPEIFKNQQPSDWHTIGEKYGTISKFSKSPYDPKTIEYPLISCTGEYCATSEDLAFFKDFEHSNTIIDKRSAITDRDVIDSKKL